jgi:hypothetical protein
MTQGPSEERIVRQMVRVLWEHPGEWLSFHRLSRLIGIPGQNADSLAGFAEYRGDLFTIAKDKRLKLLQRVVEEVAQKGIERWKIPASAVTSKPAIGGRAKTGQWTASGTQLFYPADLLSGKPVFVRQLLGPHFSRWPLALYVDGKNLYKRPAVQSPARSGHRSGLHH